MTAPCAASRPRRHHAGRLPAAIAALALAAALPVAPAAAQQEVAPVASEDGGPCGLAIVERDAAELTGVGDDVVRVELQHRALLRDGPDGACTGEVEVPAGATMHLLGCEDDWCLVTYGTDLGFVPMRMLDRMPDRVPVLR